MKRTPTLTRFLLLATAIVAFAPFAACSGGGDDDDDDDGTIEPTHCQVLWSQIAPNQRYDVYVVDMPIEEWFTGEKAYTLDVSDEVVGIFYDDYDFEAREYAARAITTGGTFSVTVASTSQGGLVQLTDDGNQVYFDINGKGELGAEVAQGGAGDFDGNWSDPDPQVSPDPGIGNIQIVYLGSALTIGTDYVNYAVCYEDDAFAPTTPAARIEAQLSRRAP